MRSPLKIMLFCSVLLTVGCVVAPVGPPGVVVSGPAYYRPVPAPAYAWGRPGWGGGYGYRRW